MHVVGLSLAEFFGRRSAGQLRIALTPLHLLATGSGRPRLPLLSLHVPLLKISLTLWQQEFTGAGHIISEENPMPNLEEAIRERAYHLWVADGQPDGKAEVHWMHAQYEILEASVANPAVADIALTKPARRVRSPKKQNSR